MPIWKGCRLCDLKCAPVSNGRDYANGRKTSGCLGGGERKEQAELGVFRAVELLCGLVLSWWAPVFT